MKVLVTGGSGFIGSYVVERLLADGQEVLVFDHDLKPDSKLNVQTFLGDIRDEVAVTEAFSHVDAFIHLAGVLGTQETIENPKPAILTNVTAGLNVLEAAAQYNLPGVNIAVGNYWENNPYSISKSTVERLVHMYNSYRGTNVAIVRALNAYGPRQSVAAPFGNSKVRKIMPSFVMRALTNVAPIEVYGDGQQIMDMIYVSDVADILVDTLYATVLGMRPKDVVEAGTGRDTTVLEIAETVRSTVIEATGNPVEDVYFLPLRPGESKGAVVKANNPLEREFVSLEEGVRRTVDWYLNEYTYRGFGKR